MAKITIVDETTMGEQYTWCLNLLDESISLRELIRRRIYQEVTEYHASQHGSFRGLVQPSDTERTLNGFHAKRGYHLDWQQQYEQAITAFMQRRYIVLIDDQQVTDLNALVTLHVGSEVTFFKLVPLVGG